MLEVDGVGLFCGRGHLQTREIKGNQGGGSKKTKGNQGESMEIKMEPMENQVTQGEGNPR